MKVRPFGQGVEPGNLVEFNHILTDNLKDLLGPFLEYKYGLSNRFDR